MNSYSSTNDKATKVVLFLISPIISLLYSLKNVNSKSSYLVYYCFIMLFGFSMFFDGSNRADGYLIAYDFQQTLNTSFEDICNYTMSFFSSENDMEVKDLYELYSKYFVSLFSSNYHIYFLFISAVFGYFALKSFRFLTSLEEARSSYAFWILVYIFFTIQIYTLSGVRYGTASWIAIYSIFCIYVKKDKRYIVLLCLTPLIHFSFIFLLIIWIVSFFTAKYEKFWYLLLLLSCFISEISVHLLQNGLELINLPVINAWADHYIGDEAISKFDDEYNSGTGFYWIRPMFDTLLRVFYYGVVIIFIKKREIIKSNEGTAELFRLLIVWFAIANFVSMIPSLGTRFMNLNRPIIAYIWLYSLYSPHINRYLKIYPVCAFLSIKSTFDIYCGLVPSSFLITPIYNIIRFLFFFVPVPTPDFFYLQ